MEYKGLSHLGDSNILGVVFVQLFCGKKDLWGGELNLQVCKTTF